MVDTSRNVDVVVDDEELADVETCSPESGGDPPSAPPITSPTTMATSAIPPHSSALRPTSDRGVRATNDDPTDHAPVVDEEWKDDGGAHAQLMVVGLHLAP